MSFDRGPKPVDPGPLPNPADTQNRIASARRRRLLSGGTQSTYLAAAAQGALPAPAKTGVG